MESGVQGKWVQGGIKNWSEEKLQRFAGLLQMQMSHLSFTWQKRVLVLYCTTAMGISISVSYWSFTHPDKVDVKVTPISTIPLRAPVFKEPVLTEKEFRRIHKWRLHLDSLYRPSRVESSLPPVRESWTLRDTLLYLEQLYQQHK